MTGIKNQEQVKMELEIKHKEEIEKLQKKIIELQELIMAKEKEGQNYFIKLSSDCFNKDKEISGLKSKIFEIKALLARKWKLPLEKAEAKLSDEVRDFKKELGIS